MRLLVLVCLTQTSCIADLDGFMHNPRHCSVIGNNTCEDQEEPIDRICADCDTTYPFAERNLPLERVKTLSFTSDGVTNDAYFIAAAPTSEQRQLTLMVSHGNYGGIEHYLHTVEALYGTGANIFTYEYPGYGKSSSESSPSETAFFANAEAAYALLLDELQQRGLAAADVVAYGISLGALPSVHLAKQHDFKAVVLESPYPSASLFLADSSATSMPASFILSGSYDNLAKLPDITEPVLLMHSEGDSFIRIEHSERLWLKMNEPKCFWRTTLGEHGVSKGIAIKEGYAVYAGVVRDWVLDSTCPLQ